MRNKMWSVRKRGVGYAILYDGMGAGILDSKVTAERLVAAANACAMVPSDALKELDVERLRQEHGALLKTAESAVKKLELLYAYYAGEPDKEEQAQLDALRATIARAKGGAK